MREIEGKLSHIKADPFLPQVHACRFMGNSAAHEIAAPSKEQLISVLDIIETLLATIYILPDKANSIDIKKKNNGT